MLQPVLQGLATDGEEQTNEYRPHSSVVSSGLASLTRSESTPSLTSEDEEITLLAHDDPPSWLQYMFEWIKSSQVWQG